MPVSASFRDFVLDQLAGVSRLRARAMFGGVGLYAGDHFFGIIAADVLYLRVDDTTRHDYELAGSSPFKPYAGRATTMKYYSVPVAVLEDAITLNTWATQAVTVARAATASKSTRTKKTVRR